MDPPQNQPRGGSSSSSGRTGANNSNSNLTTNTNNGGGDGVNRRQPKVDVYIPRHRRGPSDDASNSLLPSESTDSRQSSTASSPRNTLTTARSNSNYSQNDGFEDSSSSSRSGNNSSSSGDVQRRGRGKFMGPGASGGSSSGSKTNGGNGGTRGNGGRDRDYRGSGFNGNNGPSRNNNNSSNKSSGYGSASTSSPSSQQPSPTTTAQAPPAARHPPRGRDFDATVLRRYSDDENRPNSSFSRSSSYTSIRSNNSNNQSSSTSTYSRSTGRTQDSNAAASKRPDRSDEGSWRREVPKSIETTTTTVTSGTAEGKDEESDLTAQFERVRLSTSASASRSGSPDGTEGTDEPEEWELALENSDDDGIPAAPKDTRRHPAEALLASPSSTPSKIGNWSEAVSSDDMYILELYDFSASIKTAHLTDMFAAYENRSGGFRIKWVDETKALVIFESAAVAKQAHIANLTNQIAKIKPYNGPDRDSIRNAGKPSSGAYNGVRPAKTDSVARRLVQGALGLRVRRTPEQIAEEKAQIQAAKDAREAQRQEERRQREEEERQRQAMDDVFNS
ncbi:R3H and coiled-coil domain-containing protein 1 [Mortierella hygrophila]|uniref:R3H and coiled-coil domain-containing protein 1 n=1 Tax=Mortierella hygrophila TaxID=979708 RepID=A0A9P6FBK3_9FUNG|nr:R3H and coiled-coil domain-containing protein 1 [Mortierella hygrophila]